MPLKCYIEISDETRTVGTKGAFVQVAYLHREGKHPERFEQWPRRPDAGGAYAPGKYTIDHDDLYVAQEPYTNPKNGKTYVNFRLAFGQLKLLPVAAPQQQRAA